MKIATWNVNSIRTRLPQVQDWLISNSLDVLCIQETKVIDQDFPKTPFESLGYHVYISGQKSYNGVAILSKQPLTNVSTGFTPILGESYTPLDEQKRLITGTIQNISIINVYVPNGASLTDAKYEYKLTWLKALNAYLQQLIQAKNQICICGDFNIALEDKDIYKPDNKNNHIMSSPPEREALKSILALGLNDVFRKFTPDTGYYTWWDYRTKAFYRNSGWRIDHIYMTEELSDRTLTCIIDTTPRKLPQPSDHAPVVVEI
ncbi:MAG TPA: exodeoxyribonuclease III [Allocoleopsis sp.]